MSDVAPGVATCPRCGVTRSVMLFTSVDADTIEAQLEALLDGSFERQICDGCGHAYRPEHSLLFASHAHRLWIVMQPPLDRREFAALERGVERVIFDNFAQAPPVLTERLRGIRPRLVFGQHMLTEAVRASYLGIDPSLLECAKLLTVRRNLTELMMHGPFELCFERFEGSAPICAVHSLPHGERVAERALAVDILAEVRASQDELQAQFPDLFARPYMSATRYLIGDTV